MFPSSSPFFLRGDCVPNRGRFDSLLPLSEFEFHDFIVREFLAVGLSDCAVPGNNMRL
jgi:hypothetical protein